MENNNKKKNSVRSFTELKQEGQDGPGLFT